MALNLKKFDSYPNHCILYWGRYESYPYCSKSRYKRNAGCLMDANDEGALGMPKKKAAKKSRVKLISSHTEEEEEGYM